MKRFLVITPLLLCCVFTFAQQVKLQTDLREIGPGDTTNVLPTGSYAQKGKIYIRVGYKATYYDKDKRIIAVRKINSGGGLGFTTGFYFCSCKETVNKKPIVF